MRSTRKQVKGNKKERERRERERENGDSQFITDQKCAQPSEHEISSGSGVRQAEEKIPSYSSLATLVWVAVVHLNKSNKVKRRRRFLLSTFLQFI